MNIHKYYIHKWFIKNWSSRTSEFLNSFGSFRNSMLWEFSRKEKFDSRLNFTAWKSSFSIVSNQFAGFCWESVKSVIDKRVHDVHGFLADSNFRMNLLQDFVDVEGKSFYSFLLSFSNGCSSSTDCFGCFSWHLILQKTFIT